MSTDYRQLLWQELNKHYGSTDGGTSTFVMATGQQLLYSDYDISGDVKTAAKNTFDLVDNTIACGTNYTGVGQTRISLKWKQLLYEGKGPNAGPQQQAAFQKAKSALYVDYDNKKRTKLYDNYRKLQSELEQKKMDLEDECREKFGDGWKGKYDRRLKACQEWLDFKAADEEIQPYLRAIKEWQYGPLAGVLSPVREVFDKSLREVELPDGSESEYYVVSMIPANWYQWFDPKQPEDGPWIKIDVSEGSNDKQQSSAYGKLGGSVSAGYCFIGVKAKSSGSQEKRIETGSSRNIRISFQVRSVQINRPWLDLSALRIQNYSIPGEGPGAWSTGELSSSNKGVFPLLPTQLIVAKDITLTADKFDKEVIDTIKHQLKLVLFMAYSALGAVLAEDTRTKAMVSRLMRKQIP